MKMTCTLLSRQGTIRCAGFVILLSLAACAQSESPQAALKIGVLPFTNSTANQLQLETLRTHFIQELHKRGIDAVPLKQSNLKKARAEAQDAGCKYLVDTDVNAVTPEEGRSSPVVRSQAGFHEGAYGSAEFRLIDAASGRGIFKKMVQQDGGISSADAASVAIQLQADALVIELHTLESH